VIIFEGTCSYERYGESIMIAQQKKYCPKCGAEIFLETKFCPRCGVEQTPLREDVSSLWYLVPFFFGILGGLIAWYVNKDRDPKKARNFLIFGLVWGIVVVVILALFWVALLALLMPYSTYP